MLSLKEKIELRRVLLEIEEMELLMLDGIAEEKKEEAKKVFDYLRQGFIKLFEN